MDLLCRRLRIYWSRHSPENTTNTQGALKLFAHKLISTLVKMNHGFTATTTKTVIVVKPQSSQINHGFTATITKTVIVVKPQSSQINHGFTATITKQLL